jgi:hypothetical protein
MLTHINTYQYMLIEKKKKERKERKMNIVENCYTSYFNRVTIAMYYASFTLLSSLLLSSLSFFLFSLLSFSFFLSFPLSFSSFLLSFLFFLLFFLSFSFFSLFFPFLNKITFCLSFFLFFSFLFLSVFWYLFNTTLY